MRFFAILLVFCMAPALVAQEPLDDLLNGADAPKSTQQPASSGDGTAASETPPADTAEPNAEPTPAEPESADEESVDNDTGDAAGSAGTTFFQRLDEVTKSGALGFMRRGGFFMWPILILAVIALGVIIERFRSLMMLSTDTAELRKTVQELLQEDRIEEAMDLCNNTDGPVAAVLSAGLRKFLMVKTLRHDPARMSQEVNDAMEDNSAHIVAALERHLPVLATVAAVAPMLGFLGTVAGMITSFDDIQAKMGEMNIVEAAASGISVALLTTCFGLIVGIPAYMAYNYFESIIKRNVLLVEESASELIEGVTFQMVMENERHSAKAKSVTHESAPAKQVAH